MPIVPILFTPKDFRDTPIDGRYDSRPTGNKKIFDSGAGELKSGPGEICIPSSGF